MSSIPAGSNVLQVQQPRPSQLSGIVGIFDKSGAPVSRTLLTDLTQYLSYRAPDALNVWCDGGVGFGHALLRTTRESEQEQQPTSVDGECWINADCRLDRRGELLSRLTENGVKLRETTPDSELILWAYVVWNSECVRYLSGDFAFAIWDAPRQALFCVRDHFGIRPFYYATLGDLLVFSNTLNCVRRHPAVSAELNDVAVADFLLFGLNCDNGTTTFRDVRRLPPAHSLTVSRKGIDVARYWKAPVDGRIRYRRPADYVEHFRELFDAAVSDRMRSNQIGFLLSGGLDSASVAATAKEVRRKLPEPIRFSAQTVTYDGLISDPVNHLAGTVAKFLDLPIRYVKMDSLQAFEHWEDPSLMWPEPVDDPLFMGLYTQFRAIAADCRSVFSGEGSDNLMHFEMKPHAKDMLRRGEWTTVSVQLSRYFFLRAKRVRLRRVLKRVFNKAPNAPYFPRWIDAACARRMNLEDRLRQVENSWKDFGHSAHPLLPRGYLSLALPHWTRLFELTDAGVTRCPVEVLYPFLDLRVVDYLLALPPFPWFFEKRLLRLAMGDRLPEETLSRPKVAMSNDPLLSVLKLQTNRWENAIPWSEETSRFVDRSFVVLPKGNEDSERATTDLRPYCLNFWLQSLRSGRYNA
jgi:asparagine synthase (glutamine-hydrolysing)